eukprot:CAMPEP_0181203282 /NCGR_PEP_ID=MMETSP1096-20121128/19299_1 /TAXON_ID=156174 ORGANISM="Chrysochromulina ericina, Strain CCMP281" /NCGR_SAMPLE_ID=MMETSP1096 /ASSEMBLY_ACC=CAM_ASM_000453 /LENGTH=604 /DNA_ID=CAMNT_0023293865 /DNA_START=21 /DNA_END=1838 /DNA_ORIENTATION=+
MGGDIQPSIARQIFIVDCVYVAAYNGQKGFLAHPLVNQYLSELFMPSWGGSEESKPLLFNPWRWPRILCLIAINVAATPFLPLLPSSWVKTIEVDYRQQAYSAHVPLGLIWALPCARFGLGLLSSCIFASLLTSMPAMEPPSLEWDGSLCLYLIGMLVEEVDRLLVGVQTLGGQAGTRRYFRDVFNVLDLVSIVGLAILLSSRRSDERLGISSAEVPSQAALALFAWLRVLQGLFVFPRPGVLLLMAIRMLSDLASFLALGSSIIFAFSCSFFVLARNARDPSAPAGAYDDASSTTFGQILELVLEGTLNGEPDRMVHSNIGFASVIVSEVLMGAFGVVVVLLLLNLLIASFNYTFDSMHQNVHANYRVAFARVVVDTCERRFLPPPLNLVRWAILFVYAVLGGIADIFAGCWGCMQDHHFEKLGLDDAGNTGGLARRRGSLHSYSVKDQQWHVEKFLNKATEKGVALLPECVQDYANLHKYDIAPEERWRSSLLRDVSVVQLTMTQLSKDIRSIREHQMATTPAADGASSSPSKGFSKRARQMSRKGSVIEQPVDRALSRRSCDMLNSSMNASSSLSPTPRPQSPPVMSQEVNTVIVSGTMVP